MSKVKLLLFAVLALFAFSAVSAAVASAEDPNSPELLILEGTICHETRRKIQRRGIRSSRR